MPQLLNRRHPSKKENQKEWKKRKKRKLENKEIGVREKIRRRRIVNLKERKKKERREEMYCYEARVCKKEDGSPVQRRKKQRKRKEKRGKGERRKNKKFCHVCFHISSYMGYRLLTGQTADLVNFLNLVDLIDSKNSRRIQLTFW
ncbi:unnamed protein product, partial [Cuscuta europaea]